MPRQRSYSFRPSQKSHTLPRPQSTVYQRKPPEFGWGPSQEKLERARNTLPSHSTVPLRYQNTLAASVSLFCMFSKVSYIYLQPRITRTNVEKVSSSAYPDYHSTNRFNQPNRRFNSVTTIPTRPHASSTNYTSDGYHNRGGDRIKSQTKYVYHCGRSSDTGANEPSIMIIPPNRQPQNLYVNTYSTTYVPSSERTTYYNWWIILGIKHCRRHILRDILDLPIRHTVLTTTLPTTCRSFPCAVNRTPSIWIEALDMKNLGWGYFSMNVPVSIYREQWERI